MTDPEKTVLNDLVYLLSCAARGAAPDADRVSAMDLAAVLALAKLHMVSAMAGMALESAGVRDPAFAEEIARAQMKTVLLNADSIALAKALDQAGIWYLPLKGSVLKDYYPKSVMREMTDHDILVDPDRIADVRPIMEGMGFSVLEFGKGSHDVYVKKPVSVFEIHRELFEARFGPKKYAYYDDVKSRLLKDPDNQCGWHFSPEDFYVYMTAHTNKHYVDSGTGLRSFLDVYVFLKHFGDRLDIPYIEAQMKALGMDEFERDSRAFALNLFEGRTLSKKETEMLDFVVSSGALGSAEHTVEKNVRNYGGGLIGKLRFLFSRIFLPMEAVRSMYPFFYRHKILLPILFFYRVGLAFTSRKQYARAQLQALMREKD